MKVQVRYYSRSGNTKALANAIAKSANTRAISIEDSSAKIREKTDILFIGGALYAYGLDDKVKKYISELNEKNIESAVVFSTSWISKHSITLLKRELSKKGISVKKEYIYFKNMPSNEELKNAEDTVKRIVDDYNKSI